MIEVLHKTYICGICGAKYDSVDECENCEASHVDSLQIAGVYWDSGKKCPSYLEFITPEGDTVVYSVDPTTQTVSKKIDCRAKDPREWSDLIVIDIDTKATDNIGSEETLVSKLRNMLGI
jgi:hypothetical protein